MSNSSTERLDVVIRSEGTTSSQLEVKGDILKTLTIGQVAELAGVRTSTLRYYESIGLLPEPIRKSGQRRYEESILQKLAIIRTAQAAGFSLDELRILFSEIMDSPTPEAKWHILIERKMTELNTLLQNVIKTKALLQEIMECDGSELAECIYLTGERYKVVGG
jgi:MerR family transcriptional regulator, redox-sensitive transcriptional activator SoxR